MCECRTKKKIAIKRDNLKEARQAKGWTQAQLAAVVGVSVEQIKSLEYGRVNPSLALMFRICNALEAAPEQLFRDVIS